MEDTELEEGEAVFDDDDGNIDPDTALSYIDKRLEDVLGHFKKDFEGDVSADILGPKYGGYGSFLPAEKLNSNRPRASDKFRLEGASLNLVTPAEPLIVDDLASKDTSSLHGETFLSKSDSNLAKFSDQRSLKVRIKVGSDNSVRENVAICDDLGLLTSSPSTGHSGGSPIESHDMPLGSPGSILREMTSNHVPGNRLLSPLNESLLSLTKMERILEKNLTPPIKGKKVNSSIFVDDSSSVLENGKQIEGKEVSSRDRSKNNSDFEDKKGKKTESIDSVTPEANRAAKKDALVKKRETKREWIQDLLFGPVFTKNESKAIKHSSIEHNDNTKAMPFTKKISLDTRGSGRITCNAVQSIENKVVSKATTREPHVVKVPQLPFDRKNKSSGIKSCGITPSKLLKDDKSALKDIVKIRNSYKDIFDTKVEDQNTQTKASDMSTSNGFSADVAAPAAAEVGPAAPNDDWVACDRCEKWRLLPVGIEPENLPDKWLCSMLTWLPGKNHCDISEDETTRAVQEMNFCLISRNQDSLRYNGSGADNIMHSVHNALTHSNVNSETMPNKLKKNKSRPEGSSSSLIQTSHSSMDALQNRLKRKGSSEMNQPLIEKNVVNKPNNLHPNKSTNVAVGRNAVKVNGKDVNGGDLKFKKLKSKTESDCNRNNEPVMEQESEQDHRARDRLVISVKRQTESSEDRIGRKEKRLKTSNTDLKESTAKIVKIKLSASKDNLVDQSQEKSQQKDKFGEKDTSKMLAATSSSSKVSGSCGWASLHERKGSPVGSVSSFPMRSCNLNNLSPAPVRTISRKVHPGTGTPRKSVQNLCDIDASQRSGGKSTSQQVNMTLQSSGKGTLLRSKDKDERFSSERVNIEANDLLIDQETFPNKLRKVEVNVVHCGSCSNLKISNDVGKKIFGRRTSDNIGDEKAASLTEHDMGNPEVKPIVKKDLRNVFVEPKVEVGPCCEAKQSLDVQTFDGSGHNVDADNQNSKSVVNDRGVISFVKEYASSQTAFTAFNRAEESKDHADRIKISGFDYECKDAYFDSALKFLYAASLLEACSTDCSKSKGVDPINVYITSAKLFKTCAQEHEKRTEMAATALAYKCMEVAYMRIVYCKSLVTRQDLQTSMQIVTQGESPSSSASDVDNLNNQAALLSKSIAHPGNHHVARNQANFLKLLDFTSDINVAMEASTNTLNAYKAANAIIQESHNKDMIISVKRAVDFSFQDVKEFVFLVQNAREAINRQGFKGNKNSLSCK